MCGSRERESLAYTETGPDIGLDQIKYVHPAKTNNQ